MLKCYMSFIILFGLCSCESFLDEDPRGQQMQETFYNTDSEVLGGLLGIYAQAINTDQGLRCDLIARSEAASDLFTYKPVAAANGMAYPKYMVAPGNPILEGSWNRAYSVIFGVNAYIRALTDNSSPKITHSLKDGCLNEAKFFRAFMYYHLVMCWGDVPLRLEPTIMTETDMARSSVDEIWKAVIQDLTEASSLSEKKDVETGRISKGAVLTLLAKVYLASGRTKEAEGVLNQISGYSLMPFINDVWNTQYKYNKESIWEINREKGTIPKQGNGLLAYYLPMSVDFQGANATYPLSDYLLQMTELGSPRTKLYYSKKPLLNEITDKYKGEYVYTKSTGEEVRIVFTNATQPLYSHLMKFTDFSTIGHKFQTGDSPFNIIIFRYADVVLMKAEVECELNGATNLALVYLNQIRKRAGETLYTLTKENGLRQLKSKEDLREAIRNERALELVGEGHRFYDLKRWGTEYALTKLKESRKASIENTTPCYKPEDLTNIEAYRLLWPIPESEMNGNKQMIQNPGY